MSNIIKTKHNAGVVSKMRVISVRRLPALPEETGDATAVKEDIFAKYQTEAERLLLDSQKEAEAVRRQVAEEKNSGSRKKQSSPKKHSAKGLKPVMPMAARKGLKASATI